MVVLLLLMAVVVVVAGAVAAVVAVVMLAVVVARAGLILLVVFWANSFDCWWVVGMLLAQVRNWQSPAKFEILEFQKLALQYINTHCRCHQSARLHPHPPYESLYI